MKKMENKKPKNLEATSEPNIESQVNVCCDWLSTFTSIFKPQNIDTNKDKIDLDLAVRAGEGYSSMTSVTSVIKMQK